MRVAIGSDHAGFALKGVIIEQLKELNTDYIDFGTYDARRSDSADVALPLSRAVASGSFDAGILICGTGIGMSIIANKVPGVRAARLTDVYSARATRMHNDANIMTLGARVTGEGLAREITAAFLSTKFSGEERFVRRIEKIADIEKIFTEGKK